VAPIDGQVHIEVKMTEKGSRAVLLGTSRTVFMSKLSFSIHRFHEMLRSTVDVVYAGLSIVVQAQ